MSLGSTWIGYYFGNTSYDLREICKYCRGREVTRPQFNHKAVLGYLTSPSEFRVLVQAYTVYKIEMRHYVYPRMHNTVSLVVTDSLGLSQSNSIITKWVPPLKS